jgi:hypothetical protein
MWEPRRLTTLWAFTACYTDSFTFLPFLNSFPPVFHSSFLISFSLFFFYYFAISVFILSFCHPPLFSLIVINISRIINRRMSIWTDFPPTSSDIHPFALFETYALGYWTLTNLYTFQLYVGIYCQILSSFYFRVVCLNLKREVGKMRSKL